MSRIGEEVECAELDCANRFVKRSGSHRYCDSCKVIRARKSKRLHWQIKGSYKRKRKREERKAN